MRITPRGYIVIALMWAVTAWTLASILPFWWTKF